jgi:hypothetical protein
MVVASVAAKVITTASVEKAAVMGAQLVCVDSLSNAVSIATWQKTQ